MSEKIKNLTSFYLSDNEYVRLNDYLSKEKYNHARIYIDKLINYYIEIEESPEVIRGLNLIEDEIFNLCVEKIDDERKQIK